MGQIIFSSIKTFADNKVLEQDANGYYRVTLGALNAFNASGDFYLEDGIKDLIENESNSLARRLKAGYLKGEAGHPVYEPGMTKAEFFSRNLRIHQPLVSHHIREIILTPTNEPSGLPGRGNTVLIEGWVKPSGIHGDALKKDLDNPECNVAFSIRSFTQDVMIGGVNVKKLAQIVTWDWVVEPGIQRANKFTKLSSESLVNFYMDTLSICSMDISEISSAGKINECINCSLESNDEREMVNELIRSTTPLNNSNSILKIW
jgi:hypothetical protein